MRFAIDRCMFILLYWKYWKLNRETKQIEKLVTNYQANKLDKDKQIVNAPANLIDFVIAIPPET